MIKRLFCKVRRRMSLEEKIQALGRIRKRTFYKVFWWMEGFCTKSSDQPPSPLLRTRPQRPD